MIDVCKVCHKMYNPDQNKKCPFCFPVAKESEFLLYLHAGDIEDGGPQPRLEIKPDDPETVSLFESIKDGRPNTDSSNELGKRQRDPIHTYPSPLNNGKHRICEGHRRRMVIFNMLKLDGIWALEQKRTEQEAYEDALVLNNKKGLSTLDKAHHYIKMMEKFPEAYPTLEAIGKKVGVTKQEISLIMLAYQEIELQKPKLSPDLSSRLDKLPEGVITSIRKAPEELKPKLFETAIEEDLSVRETEKLVKDSTAVPTPTELTVESPEKAELLIDGPQIERKSNRFLDKLIEGAYVLAPEDLVKEAYGRAYGEKFTLEKLNGFLGFVFKVLFEHAKKDGKMNEVFEEAHEEALRW